MKKIIFLFLALLLIAAACNRKAKQAGNNSAATDTGETKYNQELSAGLDTVISKSKQGQAESRHSLVFAGNVFLAHGSYVAYFSKDELIKYADALKEAGATRVSVYPDPNIWIKNEQSSIAKYDALIKHVKDIGLQLDLSPEYGQKNKFSDFGNFKSKVVPVLGQMAKRYQPDIFGVVHEPTTMDTRMKLQATPEDWQKFVQEAATTVKQNSPGTLVSAGAEWYEQPFYKKWADEPKVDMLSINIYNIGKLSAYNEMIQLAKKNNKPVYIGETWRSPYQDPNNKASSLEQGISQGIGLQKYESLDQKWMEALTVYANTWNLESISPFWSTTYFKYETAGDGSAISLQYNKDAAEALMKGERTNTFKKFQQLAKEYGK